MSSLSTLHSHSILKSKFIWRFPPLKFDNLPSCTSKRLSTLDIQPLNINDELIQRQELSILIYDLGSHLNMFVQISTKSLRKYFYLFRSFTCIYTGVVYMQRFFMFHSFQQCVKEVTLD
jgi:hypothetical protein